MKEFDLQDEDVLVKGGVLTAFLEAFGAYRSRGERVLARHLDLEKGAEISQAKLYPCHQLLAGLRELQEQFGPAFMQRVGQFLYERVEFPSELETYESGLMSSGPVYLENHVNAEGKIGNYRYEKLGPRSGRMICDNPYPCAFDKGIYLGMAKNFGVEATVTHEEDEPCRRDGGERCILRIEW